MFLLYVEADMFIYTWINIIVQFALHVIVQQTWTRNDKHPNDSDLQLIE